jgi:hypothetical protein
VPVTIDLVAHNYTDFFVNQFDSGPVRYSSIGSCYYHSGNMIDLYDVNSGLLIVFDSNVTIRLCSNATTPTLTINMTINSTMKMWMFYHGNSVALPSVGVKQTLGLVSVEKARLLSNRDYSYLQQKLDFPYARDFNISFETADYSASYGIEAPKVSDVYARKIYGIYLEKDLTQGNAVINMKVW